MAIATGGRPQAIALHQFNTHDREGDIMRVKGRATALDRMGRGNPCVVAFQGLWLPHQNFRHRGLPLRKIRVPQGLGSRP